MFKDAHVNDYDWYAYVRIQVITTYIYIDANDILKW